jgi:hypothetical protein
MEKIFLKMEILASENIEMKMQHASGIQQIEMLASEIREMKIELRAINDRV